MAATGFSNPKLNNFSLYENRDWINGRHYIYQVENFNTM